VPGTFRLGVEIRRPLTLRNCDAPEGPGRPSMAAPARSTQPLPTFIKFADLKAAGIVNNHWAVT
jgi:hypothetical protein